MGFRSGLALGGVVAFSVLLGTALSQTSPSPASAQTSAPASQSTQAAALPDGPGKQVVARMCVGCHGLNTVTSKRATLTDWAQIVDTMVSRGAEGSDDDIALVTKYLAASFPVPPTPASPANDSNPQ